MDRSELTDAMREQGLALAKRLDALGFAFDAAAWVFDEDAAIWDFYIVTPWHDELGPQRMYRWLNRLYKAGFDETPPRWDEVSFASPGEQRFAFLLSSGANNISGVDTIDFTRNRVNGVVPCDMLIYRPDPDAHRRARSHDAFARRLTELEAAA